MAGLCLKDIGVNPLSAFSYNLWVLKNVNLLVNRPKLGSYSTLSSIASLGKTLKQSLLRNEEGPGEGSDATALSSYDINP